MNTIFDKEWFKRNQRLLLWLLNTPFIKVWFRWILRIRKYDCRLNERIVEIQPNNYKVYLGLFLTEKGLKYKYRADFRTHNKYSKRLYYAFYPLWLSFHIWDLFADKFAPQLSFGFLTLTAFPDPSTGVTTVDGYVQMNDEAGESFATIIAAAGNIRNATIAANSFFELDTHATSDLWKNIVRSIFTFDTSSLGSLAVISAAVMSLYGDNTYTNDNGTAITPSIDIYTSTPAADNNLAIGDYAQIQSTSQTGSPITYANWTNAAYNDFTFNSTGRGNVNKTGISRFGCRNANYDVAASVPTWSATSLHTLGGIYADTAGTSTDPKLVITYTLATDKLFLVF